MLGDLSAHQHLLHITAGQAAHRGVGIRGDNLQTFNDILRQVLRTLALQKSRMAALVAAQHHVVHNIHIAHQAHTQSVLRHKGQSDTQTANGLGALAYQVHRLAV